jgi:transposase InsO family protein
MADHLRRELVLDAVPMTLHQRKPAGGLIHHSDQGVQQYTSIDFGRARAPPACCHPWTTSGMHSTTPWP